MRNKKDLIAASTALLLVLGTGSLAQAASENDAGNETGGYVVPGDMDGVNPAYHRGIFGNAAAAKAYGFVPTLRHNRARLLPRN
jgi:hypothetical protein